MARKAHLASIMDTDIRLLRVFRVVVNCGGISASELELDIGRSTISKHVTDLEVRLGIKLCNRGRSGFSLTKEGERVLDAIDDLLLSLGKFQRRIDDIHQKLTGRLTIAFFDHTATNPSSKLSAAIRAFDSIAPAVSLDLSIEPPNVIEAGVISGRFDFGIVPIHKTSSVLQYLEVYSEKMLLYCGRAHPLFDVRDDDEIRDKIQTSKYAGLSFNSPNMVVGQQKDLTRSAVVQDEDALAVLVLSGRYLGFLPDHAAQAFVDQGEMRAIGGEEFSYLSRHAAIIRKHPEPSRILSEFLTCIEAAHAADQTGAA